MFTRYVDADLWLQACRVRGLEMTCPPEVEPLDPVTYEQLRTRIG